MKKIFNGLIFLCLVAVVVYCFKRDDQKVFVEEIKKIVITVNDRDLIVELENNSSADYFYKRLKKESITISTKDNKTEKVGTSPFDLPRNEKMTDIKPGDLVLYQSNKIRLFYEENKTSLTKLGHVTNMDQYDLRALLGKGDVVMKFSIKR